MESLILFHAKWFMLVDIDLNPTYFHMFHVTVASTHLPALLAKNFAMKLARVSTR